MLSPSVAEWTRKADRERAIRGAAGRGWDTTGRQCEERPRTPGREEASGFHEEKTARDLMHAFSLEGALPSPVGENWFWEKGSKKFLDIIIVYGPIMFKLT